MELIIITVILILLILIYFKKKYKKCENFEITPTTTIINASNLSIIFNMGELINTSEYAIIYHSIRKYLAHLPSEYYYIKGFLFLMPIKFNPISNLSYSLSLDISDYNNLRSVSTEWRYGSNRDRLIREDPQMKDLSYKAATIDDYYPYMIQQIQKNFIYANPNIPYSMYKFTKTDDKIYFHREFIFPVVKHLKKKSDVSFMGLLNEFITLFTPRGPLMSAIRGNNPFYSKEIDIKFIRNLYLESKYADITSYINNITNNLITDIYNKFNITDSFIDKNRFTFIPTINEENILFNFTDKLLDISSIQSRIEFLNIKINNINNIKNIYLNTANNGLIGETKFKFELKELTNTSIIYVLSFDTPSSNNIYKIVNRSNLSSTEINNALSKNTDISSRLNVSYIKDNNNNKIIETNKATLTASYGIQFGFTTKGYTYSFNRQVNDPNIIYKNKQIDITYEMNSIINAISNMSIFVGCFVNILREWNGIKIIISKNNNVTDAQQPISVDFINQTFNAINRFTRTRTITDAYRFYDAELKNQQNNINKLNSKINDINNINNIFFYGNSYYDTNNKFVFGYNKNGFDGLILECYFTLSIKEYSFSPTKRIVYSLSYSKPNPNLSPYEVNIYDIKIIPTKVFENGNLVSKLSITKNNIDTDSGFHNRMIEAGNDGYNKVVKIIQENNKYYFTRKLNNLNDRKCDITDNIKEIFNSIPLTPGVKSSTLTILNDEILYTLNFK
jgi:hypothetical protein